MLTATSIRHTPAFVDRLTTFDERNSWGNKHAPCHGVRRTPSWEVGRVYHES